ncbi:MAG TPA: SEFIR domain-containing protein [Nitratidesulfovibrio sp.]|nr:SEFIR domain-containing protein [Nitratidesulfovibrio sp.]
MNTPIAAPKLFISYSWTSPEHEAYVLDIATQLRESGIDVILDKWDLKEGNDAIAFMEKMVTDASINKVLIICDEKYASKADNRHGGVGTETQIISRQVYESQAQEKFVVAAIEKDANGKPILPSYYSSRIYIDLTDSEIYGESFEKLVRWIYDKPIHIKPPLGNRPTYIEDTPQQTLGTSAAFRRCSDALKNGKPHALGAATEYFSIFSNNLESIRISETRSEHDDAVIESIQRFISSEKELISLINTILIYTPHRDFTQSIYKFIESIIKYNYRQPDSTQWLDTDFDNYKFITHEIFLHTVASFIFNERFEELAWLLDKKFYITQANDTNNVFSFSKIQPYIKSFEIRKNRLQLRQISIHSDLLIERSQEIGHSTAEIMQADFVLYLRSQINNESLWDGWYPKTLLYVERHHFPFEIFAKSESTEYYNRIQKIIGVKSAENFSKLLEEFTTGKRKAPSWDYHSISPANLAGQRNLGTRP